MRRMYWVTMLFLGIWFIAGAASAEIVVFHDSTGKTELVDTENAGAHAMPEGPWEMHGKAGGITFNVSYEDVTAHNGIGFDNATNGAARRARVSEVFTYLNSVLNHTGVCDVVFTVSDNAGSGGALATGGTYYWQTPGFTNGFAFDHITTGTDSSGSIPDIHVVVHFGWPWYQAAGTPSSSEIDLKSVLLHEVTHGLGFSSLSMADGASDISSSVYTKWDDLLETGNGEDLCGGNPPDFLGLASDLTGGDGGVRFTGANAVSIFGSKPPIYAPSPWQGGSSIAHWNVDTAGHPAMEPAIGNGEVVRQYAPFEIGAMKDIGYSVVNGGGGGETSVFRVDEDNVSGTENGLTWATAFNTIQEGTDAAAAGASASRPHEVWVAAGTYTNSTSDVVVTMRTGVHLYGGFAGTETSRNQRYWATRTTTIDGENARGGVEGASNATLDGFTIMRGKAGDGGGMYNFSASPAVTNCTFSGNSAEYGDGGGMYNSSSSSPAVTNCTFSENSAAYCGGGMHNAASSPAVTDCTFTGNSAILDGGGGMSNTSSSSPLVKNCIFDGNFVELGDGGGIYNSSASPTVTDCTFSGNSAFYYGGGMYNSSALPTVTNCAFTGNSAEYGDGGGMYNSSASPTVTKCTLSGNSAGYYGGGMHNASASPAVTDCIFTGNWASLRDGGGMSNSSSSPTVTNCIFDGNSTEYGNGGGIYNSSSSSPVVLNCTLSANTIDVRYGYGSGIYGGSPKVTNCILWGEPDGIQGGTPTVTYSCVQGGFPGTGNISANPNFDNTSIGGLELRADSPCIDAGTSVGAPADDILGVSRPQGEGVDMGAYEHESASGTGPTAAFSASPRNGPVPLRVYFTDQSDPGSGTISAWAWDFDDDGATDSTQKNPSHQYATAGSYTVTLTVTTTAGSDSETKGGYISVSKGTPTVSVWPTASAIIYGQTLADSNLSNGTASVVGSFSFDDPGIMPAEGLFSAAVTFTPDDSVNYVSVQGRVNVTVLAPQSEGENTTEGEEPIRIVVPNVIGMTLANAEAGILGAGLALGAELEEYSATVAAGRVIGQAPAGGTQVSQGSSVTIVVSRGPFPSEGEGEDGGPVLKAVPNVVGMTQANAEAAILGAGFAVEVAGEEYSVMVDSGKVKRQMPTGGTEASLGSHVAIVISKGPLPTEGQGVEDSDQVSIPYVVGMTQADAETAIVRAGLVIGAIAEEYNATLPEGVVFMQYPSTGARVAPGSAVDISVSKGPRGFGSEGEGEGSGSMKLVGCGAGGPSTGSSSIDGILLLAVLLFLAARVSARRST